MKDRTLDILFVVAILALSVLARIPLLSIESGDYVYFLSVWMDRIREMGPWQSLAVRISDYSSAYMYIMCLVSGIGNGLLALKTVSIIFDYVAAGAVFALVSHLTGSRRKGIAGMAAALLCPTVLFNSAWWCQCDIIYVSFLLLCLLFLFKGKGLWSCLMMGIAFSFKVQAVFLLPFLVLMCYKKREGLRWWQLLLIPAVFFAFQIPAWIAGRPLGDLLGVYFLQMGEWTYGTMQYPNFYTWLDETTARWHHMKEVGAFGLYFALGCLGCLSYWICARKFRLTKDIMLSLALLSVGLVLFTLPHMHERYGLLLDVLAIVYALQRPGKTPIALGYIVISLLTYMPFLNGVTVVPAIYLSFALLALHLLVGRDLAHQIEEVSLEEA